MEGNSLLHQLDSRFKTAALIWLSLLAGLTEILGLSMVSVGVIALFPLSRLPLKVLQPLIVVFFWLSLFYLAFSGWVWDDGWQVWRGYWSESGLKQAGMILWRISLIFYLTRVFLAVTKPLELGLSIAWFLNPLTRISAKASDGILLITLTLQFIPLLTEEAAQLWKAKKAKGNLGKSLFSRSLDMLKLVQPMLLLSLRRAEELAENLLTRGYHPGRYRVISNATWRKSDTTGVVILGVWSAAILFGPLLLWSWFQGAYI